MSESRIRLTGLHSGEKFVSHDLGMVFKAMRLHEITKTVSAVGVKQTKS